MGAFESLGAEALCFAEEEGGGSGPGVRRPGPGLGFAAVTAEGVISMWYMPPVCLQCVQRRLLRFMESALLRALVLA